MTDADDAPPPTSEQTDPTQLGETVDDAGWPGDDFPPDRPLGVEDPSILGDGYITTDDVETRSAREEPEAGDAPPKAPEIGRDLIDPSDDPDQLDDESELIATRSDDYSSAAEVIAVHEIPSDQTG